MWKLNCYIVDLITVEYDIHLTVLECIEPYSRKSEDGRNRGSDYWIRIRNVQKNVSI